MLTDQYIRDLIEEYSKTSDGKKKIKEICPRRRFVPEYASDDGSVRRQIDEMCKDMRDILYNHIKEVIPSFQISDIVISKPTRSESGLSVCVQFNKESLRRKSLYEAKYPEGIHDIVRLFVTGYSTGADTWGIWHGKPTRGLRGRSGNDFMERAVNEFNDKYGNVATATLDEVYQE